MIRSPIFYMGNKYKLLKQLLPLFPDECETFIDAFGGSGVVSLNYQGSKRTIYNELNPTVVKLLRMFKENKPEQLNEYFESKIKEYGIRCLGKDFRDYKDLQKGYFDFREYYNNSEQKDLKDLYLLSCYSMNHLMRFNRKSEFNVACGSTQKYQYTYILDAYAFLQNVDIANKNIFDLDLNKLGTNDFIYFDPPYTNTEAIYNDELGWDIASDLKLFDLLEQLNSKGIKWGMSNVFENRGVKNEHLIKWCNKHNWQIHHLERNYNPFSKGNSNSDGVYICNYIKPQKHEQMSLF